MMPPVWIGLTVAFASALVTNTAYSLEHDAAAALPPLSPRRPFRSAKLLLGDRRWLTAFAAETAGWLMYVAALRLAPLSLVQAVAASGVAVLAFATARGHPSRLAWREQFAVVLALAGLMLLALSLVDTTESDQRPGAVGVIIWLAACGGGAALLVAIPTRFGRAASLGLAAGLLFADGDISAKLSGYGGPWLVAIAALIVAYATGTTVLQSAYQRGDALTAAGTATMVTNAVPIAAGFVLFGETLPHGMRAVLQIAAFACLVVSAVALGHQQSPQAGQPASRADRGSIRPRGSTMDQASARNTARDARATGTAGEPAAVSPDRPTGRELLGEIWSVAQDLPLFLTAPLYRSWHLHWGATPAEAAAPMPGDALVPGAQYRSTRAITISAPTTQVWPWLVQVGCLRAGFYSNDLLDNLARPSARTIVPALQHLEVGQLVPMSPSAAAPERTAFRVHSFQEGEWLLWSKSDSTWAWSLRPTDRGGTRLVTRIRARYDWRHPLAALVALLLMEAGDFAMLRRMLRGIRSRAESHSDGSRTAKGPDALTQA